ncbi:MAG: hypothetical protein LBN24_10845 [Mediterranea sp.]|jgi:hypothetical protein|nr:hypothetical protein [Mediterranea sp.]
MKYIDWQKSPQRFKAMTGMDVETFMKLPPFFEEAHNVYLSIQEAHADLFSITQHQCHEFAHGLNEILRKALETAGYMPGQNA